VLQSQRPKLPRDMKNNLGIPFLAFLLVIVALASALISNADVIPFLLFYLFVLNILLIAYLYRLKVLFALETMLSRPECLFKGCLEKVRRWNDGIQKASSVVYFSKTANICRLNQSIQYVLNNEDANHCRIVHVYEDEGSIPRQLVQYSQLLDATYPAIRVDVIFVRSTFGAPLIDFLSSEWGVEPNLMFITCPASVEAGKRIEDLRGVRVIMGHEDESYAEHGRGNYATSPDAELERAMLDSCPIKGLLEHGIAQERCWSMPLHPGDSGLMLENGGGHHGGGYLCLCWGRRRVAHGDASTDSSSSDSEATDSASQSAP